MKKISWLVPECFIDVDIPVISKLQQYYKIRLILLLPFDGIDNKKYVNHFFSNTKNVEIIYEYIKYRGRSPQNIAFYNRIISTAKAYEPDLYYLSFMGLPYALWLYALRLPISKCVVPCHNVTTPKGARNETVAEVYKQWWLRIFQNIQVFSQSQHTALKELFPNKNIFMAYLMLKDYGSPSKKKSIDDKIIRFLFFGNIVKYKRLDLLIEATNVLVERGVKNFKVVIAGNCKDWSAYKKEIKHEEYVESRIERIPNEDVPDLFASCHYMVLPYQDIAQSGAITVAFNYNLPTIVSDIEQFKEFVVNGVTSLSFKSESAISLADTIEYVINNHDEIYYGLRVNQRKFIEERFSDTAIVDEYKTFFDRL